MFDAVIVPEPELLDAQGAQVLSGLDSDQVSAVTAPVGLVVVKAGAGSGKTTVLTRRIVHRIASKSADSQHVLAFTFTRQAGAELARRLDALGAGRDITTGTFHSIAYSLLRQRWSDTNRAPRNVISSRTTILSRILPSARNDSIAQVSNEIDWCRARMIAPANYRDAASQAGRRPPLAQGEFERALIAYEDEKRKRRVVDLDDLIALVIEEMRNDRNFADQVRWRFRHIHVDEGQDMNPLQYSFVRAIADGRNDLFIVGDPCQAIYGWNGADPALFDRLINADHGIFLVNLPNNYRCSPEIVDAAKHVLTTAGMLSDAVARAPHGPAVQSHSANTPEDEAQLVADLLRNGATDAPTAVLVRTNAQTQPIRKALADAGLEVCTSTLNGSAISEALRGASAIDSLESILEWAEDLRSTTATAPLADLVADFVVQSHTSNVTGSSFQAWLFATGALRDPGSGSGIEVLTFHAAKGREWSRVVVAGCEKGLAPHSSAITALQLAEEARLVYVAITRAEHELHFTRCVSRNNKTCQPSPWLKSLPTGAPTKPVHAPADVLESVAKLRGAEVAVMKELRAWRRNAARVACTTETAVCSDAELRRIADAMPSDEEALADLLGPIQARRHAPKILAITAANR